MDISVLDGEKLKRIWLRWVRKILFLTPETASCAVQLTQEGYEVTQWGSAPLDPQSQHALLLNAQDLSNPTFQEALASLSLDGATYVLFSSVSDLPDWEALGLFAYFQWRLEESGELLYIAAEAVASSSDPVLVMAVRRDYDPVAHARRLLASGAPQQAFEVLGNILEEHLTSPEARGLVWAEKALCLYALDRAIGQEGRLTRFSQAQDEFYKATTYVPNYTMAYHTRALFWQALGRPDMARRLLQSLLHVGEDAETRGLLETIPSKAVDHDFSQSIPPWSGRPLRLLLIVHTESDYGADVLYDGLCRAQGRENIVDFPYKPTLHGEHSEHGRNYPCFFNWPGQACDLAAIEAELKAGAFDAMLLCDTLKSLPVDSVRSLLKHQAKTPLFILDTWDQPAAYAEDLDAHFGFAPPRGYFKREMIAEAPYPENTWPMPFAYAERFMPEALEAKTRSGCFWAGQAVYGARRLKLSWLEERFQIPINRHYAQEEYRQALAEALIGLCFFGNGFDTVRYWELPAHGVMLLAERPPIYIPHNFEDGVSAVFFDDLADLEEKLSYYLAHPEEAAAIATAGREHFLRYHTGLVRAKQLLGWIEAALA